MGGSVQSLFVFQLLQAVTQETKSLQTILCKYRSSLFIYAFFFFFHSSMIRGIMLINVIITSHF